MDTAVYKEIVHYGLHFVFPALIAWLFYKLEWKRVYLMFLSTMLVDLDHIFANPVFEAGRNSIGFHPLHSYPAIAIYILGALFLKGNLRIISIGLLLHIMTDFQDYYLWNH